MKRRQGVGKKLRKNGNLPCFCMGLGESLSFSVILKKCFSKIIRLGVRCACVCLCVCVWRGKGPVGYHYKMLSRAKNLVKNF